MAAYDPRYQVKRFRTRVRGRYGPFDVFETGAPGWVLFRAVAGAADGQGGYNTGLEFPVRRRDLKRGVLPPRR